MDIQIYCFLCNDVQKRFSEEPVLLEFGYANGYVAMPTSIAEKMNWEDYDDVEINVHGGLTYSGNISSVRDWNNIECINCNSLDEIPDDYWVIGFDTFHAGDGPHLNRNWCIEETKNLMEQTQKLIAEKIEQN